MKCYFLLSTSRTVITRESSDRRNKTLAVVWSTSFGRAAYRSVNFARAENNRKVGMMNQKACDMFIFSWSAIRDQHCSYSEGHSSSPSTYLWDTYSTEAWLTRVH